MIWPEAGSASLQKHLLDIDVLPFVKAATLIAADHGDGGNIHAARGHQLAGQRLIAGREANHPIQKRAINLHFDVGGDEIAGRQDVGTYLPALVMKSLGAAVRILKGSPPASRMHRFTSVAIPSR